MNELDQAVARLALQPENPQHNVAVAVIYHDLGHTAAALSYYMRAAERSDDTALSYACLIRSAQCFESQNHRHVSVRSLLKRAIVLMPRRPEAYWYLAKFNESTSQHSDCYMLCRQAQEFCSTDHAPLPLSVGYPGAWAFDFERAVSAWWWGMNQESRDTLRDLVKHRWQIMDDQHRRALAENIRRIGDEQKFFDREYDAWCATASDINEHLPTLRALAEQCEHVTEMGVRTGASTRAFLASKRVLRSYDLYLDSEVQAWFDLANLLGRDAVYTKADVLTIHIDETDLLFIDTLHNYDQLRQELARHSSKVRRFMVFHDTETFGHRDEMGTGPGLAPALEEFLGQTTQWRLQHRYTNNNGLTVLQRC